MARFTDRTITDRALLGEELQRVRSQGYAVDDIEHEPGVRCVGAAIHDHAGSVFASISISGPTARITPNRVTELGKLVKETADEVSSRLGYRRDGAGSSANQQTDVSSGSPSTTPSRAADGEAQEQT
jgi:DNA-binding IclR family transcriptional regulator